MTSPSSPYTSQTRKRSSRSGSSRSARRGKSATTRPKKVDYSHDIHLRAVRNRGAGAYQFSLDEETRLAEKAALDAQRTETEKARAQTEKRGMSAAQEAKKRRLDERRALVEAKRAKLLGGAENVARLREKKRAEEVDKFVLEFDGELGRRSASPSKK